MICKILVTTDEGQVLAGTFKVKDGEVSVEAYGDNEAMMQELLTFVCHHDSEKATAKNDPERWLELLPENINGSYLRAQLVK